MIDPERSKRGRTARQRGNAFERWVAKKLGVKRVGMYGGKDDVGDRDDWIVAQTKCGKSYPERLDSWLRAVPANENQLRALVLGDAPGAGTKRRVLIVMDFQEFVDWYGK